MNYVSSFKKISRAKKLGVILVGAVLSSAVGIPAYMNVASAASLSDISDTIISSAPSTATNHTIVYTSYTAATAGQTIRIQFTPGNSGGATDEFTLPSFATSTDITISGPGPISEVANAAACDGTSAFQVYNSLVNNIASNRYIELTVCPTDTAPIGTYTIDLLNNRIVNPSTVNSYVVRVAGTQTDSADTRVAIVNTVTMSAKVDTIFTFTITGAATSTTVNGTTTSVATTPTQIAFNTLTPGTQKTAAQFLNVTTNAQNGFQVTVVQNQNLLSSTLADINTFIDDADTAVPVAWQSPANTLGANTTYGHYGVTSDDNALTAGDEFSAGAEPLWAGNIDTARQVMFHGAPADGILTGVGSTTVAYRIEIGTLQEAANDYNNTLTYVATPIF